MIVTTIASLLLSVAPQQCVKPAENSGAAKGAGWFVKGDPISYKGKKYVKFGLARQPPLDAIEQTGTHSYTAVFTEKGVKDAEMLYLLADLTACSFQPYMVEPVMIAATVLALGGVQTQPCVMAGEVGGVERDWFRKARPIKHAKAKYGKYGGLRVMGTRELEWLRNQNGVPVLAERNARKIEVLYVLADAANCTFQPYMIEKK